jgi:hypothetical protein
MAGPKYKKSFKVFIKVVGGILIILVVIFGYKIDVYFRNIAQQQSVFIENYAKSQHMVQFATNGDNGKFPSDNTTPWYEMFYKSTMPTTAINNSLQAVLDADGYKVNDVYFNPAPCWPQGPQLGLMVGSSSCPGSPALYGAAYNGDKPYWLFDATKGKLEVGAYIANVSYTNDADTSNLYQNIAAEHPVPKGYNVLDVTLTDN